jgi:hypothetical protein
LLKAQLALTVIFLKTYRQRQTKSSSLNSLQTTDSTARLAQYIVADGRAEVREMQPTGEQTFNEETMEMEDVMMKSSQSQPLNLLSLQSHVGVL